MDVVVRQTSGLGNQLFQYAAGRYLAKRLGASLRIANELPRNLVRNGHRRPVLLSKFAIAAQIGKVSAFDRLVLSRRPYLALVARVVQASLNIQVIRQREGNEALLVPAHFPIAPKTQVVYLTGYWQAEAIVREVEGDLRKELSFIEPPKAENLRLAEQISAAPHPVSIHLRRGDYATVFGADSMLPTTYYDRAIAHMRGQFDNCTFFVFSDDSAFARTWAQDHRTAVVVHHNNAERAHEDLRLMSLCHHHILANSTFSWWGAWLNKRSSKQVIAPSKWLGLVTTTTTIADPKWILVEI